MPLSVPHTLHKPMLLLQGSSAPLGTTWRLTFLMSPLKV